MMAAASIAVAELTSAPTGIELAIIVSVTLIGLVAVAFILRK
jgi:hypothetical protein